LFFTIVASFSSHAFWTFEDAARRAQQHTQFWKNTTMKGGLLLLFVTAGGRYSLDWLLARKASQVEHSLAASPPPATQ
jgi:putative oxidoreductase